MNTKTEILSQWGIAADGLGWKTPPTIGGFPRKGWWPSARTALSITVTYWKEEAHDAVMAAYDAAETCE